MGPIHHLSPNFFLVDINRQNVRLINTMPSFCSHIRYFEWYFSFLKLNYQGRKVKGVT